MKAPFRTTPHTIGHMNPGKDSGPSCCTYGGGQQGSREPGPPSARRDGQSVPTGVRPWATRRVVGSSGARLGSIRPSRARRGGCYEAHIGSGATHSGNHGAQPPQGDGWSRGARSLGHLVAHDCSECSRGVVFRNGFQAADRRVREVVSQPLRRVRRRWTGPAPWEPARMAHIRSSAGSTPRLQP